MTFETIAQIIETTGAVPIRRATEVVESLLSSYEDEQLDAWLNLYKLLDLIYKSQKFDGDADDFHNFAVSLARESLYDRACALLEIGLRYTSKSVDLLADYLVYGIKCDKFSEAQIHYNTLKSVPKEYWNWRAYDFSIDYLLMLLQKGPDEQRRKDLNSEIDDLLDGFKKRYPDDERVYFSEYTVWDFRGKTDEAIKNLKCALEERTSIKAPRCAMKLADYYFEHGHYDSAMAYIKKSKTYVTVIQPTIEPGYVYMLSALCGISALYNMGIDTLDQSEKKSKVMQIYKDCEAAELAHHRKRLPNFGNLETQRDILEKLSDIPYSGI